MTDVFTAYDQLVLFGVDYLHILYSRLLHVLRTEYRVVHIRRSRVLTTRLESV